MASLWWRLILEYLSRYSRRWLDNISLITQVFAPSSPMINAGLNFANVIVPKYRANLALRLFYEVQVIAEIQSNDCTMK